MPVTAKLSRKFYETFGDDVVNELVEWLNQVDATYRLELRELNELNFARFDAKLEQRIAELRADLRTEFERRFTALDAKLEQRTAELRAEFREGQATLEGRLLARIGLSEARLVRWMFVFWAASVGSSIALIQLTR
jgi:hypothetical protein